jgi:hypothetical protein
MIEMVQDYPPPPKNALLVYGFHLATYSLATDIIVSARKPAVE